MNLSDLRTKFKEFSGRYDLDNKGVDFFINAGVRHLNSVATSRKSVLRYQKDLASGQFYIDVPDLRYVHSVWISDSDGKSELSGLNLDDVRRKYGKNYSSIKRSKPKHYGYTVRELAADQWNATSSPSTYDKDDLGLDQYARKMRLLVLPPADKLYTVTVFGRFVARELVNDTDDNYWTIEYPDLVLMAALYKLEVFYRNTEGASDWKRDLLEGVMGIEKDAVDWEYGDINVMEG